MALSDIIGEYPVFDDSNQARFRHPFKQGDVIQGIGDRDGDFNIKKAQAGACYSLCISAASHLLEGRGFSDFNDAYELEMAIRTQLVEQFEITPQALRLREVVPTIVEREYTTRTWTSPFITNKTLKTSLDIVNAIIARRAVVMLVLRPSAAGSGHTLLFDTRNRALFFDPNYGWFVDTARPAQGGNFADWYRRFYHATVYKGLFEHGRRQLVIWE